MKSAISNHERRAALEWYLVRPMSPPAHKEAIWNPNPTLCGDT